MNLLVATLRSMSSLLDHIKRVVLMCAQEEMLWIATGRIVTAMKDKQAIGNWAVVHLVGKARGNNLAKGIVVFASDAKYAITQSRGAALPFPTFVGAALIYLFPKANLDRSASPMATAVPEVSALKQTATGFSLPSDGRDFAASATAQAGRIRTSRLLDFARTMIAQIAHWFAFDPSGRASSVRGYAGLLSTTTMAVAVGNLIKREVHLQRIWGRLEAHQKLTFWCHAAGRFQSSLRRFALACGPLRASGFTPSFYHMRGA